jgi:hypothetical protein
MRIATNATETQRSGYALLSCFAGPWKPSATTYKPVSWPTSTSVLQLGRKALLCGTILASRPWTEGVVTGLSDERQLRIDSWQILL